MPERLGGVKPTRFKPPSYPQPPPPATRRRHRPQPAAATARNPPLSSASTPVSPSSPSAGEPEDREYRHTESERPDHCPSPGVSLPLSLTHALPHIHCHQNDGGYQPSANEQDHGTRLAKPTAGTPPPLCAPILPAAATARNPPAPTLTCLLDLRHEVLVRLPYDRCRILPSAFHLEHPYDLVV